MTGAPLRVLVLYRHSLLGRGIAELLSQESSLRVDSVDEADDGAVCAALEDAPDVIVFEEGGPFEPLELLRRSRCPLLIDVSIGSREAWTIRRDGIGNAPDRLFELILGRGTPEAGESPASAG